MNGSRALLVALLLSASCAAGLVLSGCSSDETASSGDGGAPPGGGTAGSGGTGGEGGGGGSGGPGGGGEGGLGGSGGGGGLGGSGGTGGAGGDPGCSVARCEAELGGDPCRVNIRCVGQTSLCTFDFVDADGDRHTSVACGGSDCDDANAAIEASLPERCDGLDNDCNGVADDAPVDAATFYLDADGDGTGADAPTVTGCTAPAGYAAAGGDCDDADPAVGAGPVYYTDADGDSFGDPASAVGFCAPPGGGFVLDGTDCAPQVPAAHPGAAELCLDGVDGNCDGTVDEGCPAYHCGVVARSESWANTALGHHVGCTVLVEGAAPVLTLEAGARVTFAPGAGLVIGQGAAGDLVVDGQVTAVALAAVAPGNPWSGVELHGVGPRTRIAGLSISGASRGLLLSSPAQVAIDALTVERSAGTGVEVRGQGSGGLTLTACNLTDNDGDGLLFGSGELALDGCTISGSLGRGLFAGGAELSLANSTVSGTRAGGGGGDGLVVDFATLIARFEANVFTGNAGHPAVLLDANQLLALDVASSFAGNGNDRIRVDGPNLYGAGPVALLDVPIQLAAGLLVFPAFGSVPDVQLSGAVLELGAGTGIVVGGGAEARLELTSTTLRGSGGARWLGVEYRQGGTGRVTGCDVSGGGGNGLGNVALEEPGVNVTSSAIHDSAAFGIHCSGGCAAYTGDTITGNSFANNTSGDRN